MSTRGGKRRGRPPKTPVTERSTKFQYQLLKKPKYLTNRGSDSQFSTPSASRASSPQNSDDGVVSRRISARPSRRGRPSQTPVQTKRGAHSTASSARKAYESEYHYGSDFGDSSDDREQEDDFMLSGTESESVDPIENESDSDFSLSSYSTHSNANNAGKKTRHPTPEPVWLQDIDVPELELPRSSDDLMAPPHLVLRITSLYEVLRRFRNLVRLSPFRLEDFCAALMCDEQSNLLSEIHMMLLKAIVREEDTQTTHFGPLDQKDSVNISLYLMDDYTWPEIMRSYVESDPAFDADVLAVLTDKEYPFCAVEDRIRVLQFLVDQLLITTPVRDNLLQEAPFHYDDHCRICHRLGDLLCCETCPAVYHLECVDPPLTDVPTEDWQCNICKEHKVSGVNDCLAEQERHGMLCRQDHLGYDRHGRKYWFVCRRIFVETEDGTQMWYYSTVAQLEALLARLDEDSLELGLCGEIGSQKEEIVRQMELTEALTNQHKGGKKSYLEVLQERAESQQLLEDEEEEEESSRMEVDEDGRMTRNRLQQISTGTLFFKLGMENAFKTYENQFSININALNKPQRNEERDKKRHLSHKFSLTDASQFKWSGGSSTSLQNIILALRGTVMQLEQTIPPPFMHPNWANLKKIWVQAVMGSERPQDFARVLIALQACIKACLFANVWYEQLGHTRLYRITSNEREEKKKQEKREKRDYADEEERNRWAYNFVKYTLGMKHQCWKQKGEEYRIHGQWSWMWLSANRREAKAKKTAASCRIEAQRVMAKVKTAEGKVRVIAVAPITYERLVGCADRVQEELGGECGIEAVLPVKAAFDYIDVCAALTTSSRILYPKVGKRSRLDVLLARRTALLEAEEKEMAVKTEAVATNGKAASGDLEDEIPKQTISNVANLPTIPSTENDLLRIVGERPGKTVIKLGQAAPGCGGGVKSAASTEAYNALAKEILPVKTLCHQLNKMAKNFKCYDKDCNMGPSLVLTKVSTCYSPMCMQRDRVRVELLKLIRKGHVLGFSSKEMLTNSITVAGQPTTAAAPAAEAEDTTGILDMADGAAEDTNSPVQVSSADDLEGMLNDIKQALDMGHDYDDEVFGECLTKKAFEIEMEEKAVEDDKLKQEADAKAAAEPTPVKMEVDPLQIKEEPLPYAEEGPLGGGGGKDDSLGGAGDAEATPKRSMRGRPPKAKSVTKMREEKALAAAAAENGGELGKNGLPEEKTHKWSVLKPKRRFTNKNPKVRREQQVKLEPELGPGGARRVFSVKCTQGKIALRKRLKVPPSTWGTVLLRGQKGRLTNKYPIVGNFMSQTGRRSILMLPRHELMHVARCGGRVVPYGYNPQSKTNISVWPYPCPRPLFKTCWIYRLLNAKSLNAMCLGVRIMWTCFRWDDMQTKPPTVDGKNQVTTENEIVNLELLKHRHVGRHLERTQFLRRKVIIPLELPKAVREVTSIRLGLRKRKRADSPQHTEPQVSEEWIDEDKLELWEIRQYGERQDRSNVLPVTRQATGKLPPARQYDIVGNAGGKQIVVMGKSNEEIKEKLEQQLRLQRMALNQKRALESKGLPGTSAPKQIIKYKQIQVRQPDGSIKVINQQILTNPPPRPVEQKVQIFRGADGKLSVKGLLPGQQVIQMPDGKIQIVTTGQAKTVVNRAPGSVITTQSGQQLLVKQQAPGTPKTLVQKILNPGATSTPNILQKNPQAKLVAKVATDGAAGASQPKVVTTSLQQLLAQNPGQKIVLNQGMPNQRIIIAPNNPSQPGTPQQHILVQQPGGQVIQQIVQSGGAPGQQQIMVGNRILMNTASGQRLITAAPVQAATIVSPVKTIVQQPQQPVVVASASPQVHYQAIPATTTTAAQPQVQQQVVVQNNQSIAQQLASGKLQMINYNGQQVIVKPMANNSAVIVAHVKQQEHGPAQIVLTQQASGIIGAADDQQPPGEAGGDGEQAAASSQLAVAPPAAMPSPGQQPGTITKTITAQILQTDNGPRIVLQGLGQNDLTPQQLAIVQQQVKQSLMKNQDGKLSVGPTRIQLTVAQAPPPPLAPVQGSPSKAAGAGHQTGEEDADEEEHDGAGEVGGGGGGGGASINEETRKGIIQKVLARTGGKAAAGAVNSPKPGQFVRIEGQSIVGKSNNSAIGQQLLLESKDAADGDENGFKITPDYIQETIKNALKQSNLNPEIEEKLLNLQRYQEQQMKDGLDAPYTYTPVTPTYTASSHRKRVVRRGADDDDDDLDDDMDELDIPEDDDDEDWYAHKRRRKPYVPKSERKSMVQRNVSPFVRPKPLEMAEPRLVAQRTVAVSQHGGGGAAVGSPMVIKSMVKSQPHLVALQPKPQKVMVQQAVSVPKVVHQVVDQSKKLTEVLNKQKDQLREDILRKREQFEQELKHEIQEEVNSKLVVIRGTTGGDGKKDQENDLSTPTSTPVLEKGRKRVSGSSTAAQARKELANDSFSAEESPPKTAKLNSSSSSSGKGGSAAKKTQRSHHTATPSTGASTAPSSSKKKEKLLCICRTPYDKNKFYLGCDMCSNWYHGDCIGITAEESKKMDEYVCDECKNAREKQVLYCLCKQPYDESQFYICCDKCQDWFHGHCVNVSQKEADAIDEYVCPNCTQNDSANSVNMKPLSAEEFENLKKLIKQITGHKMAWPFLEAVDPKEVADYYTVITDPMDLNQIETRINTKWYKTLSDFITDMTKIFDNCRYYNPKESQFYKCAEGLEAFFVQKIKQFRDNVAT